MMEVDDSDYNDSHRAFLQAFLARGTLTYETSKPVLAAILSVREGREVLPNDVTEDYLKSYIAAVNIAISSLDFEIRSTFRQGPRERIYALINTTSDPLTQMATTHSVDEVAFAKRMLDWMFDGPGNTRKRESLCITSTEAVNLSKANPGRRDTQNGNTQANSQGITMRDAETMLTKLTDEGWFERSGRGYYSLAPRALMELRGWLVETYNDPDADEDDEEQASKIKFCKACSDIVTVGQRCSTRDCLCRLHNTCVENFFRIQRSKDCPLCKVEWDSTHFVGEKAITGSERPRQSNNRRG